MIIIIAEGCPLFVPTNTWPSVMYSHAGQPMNSISTCIAAIISCFLWKACIFASQATAISSCGFQHLLYNNCRQVVLPQGSLGTINSAWIVARMHGLVCQTRTFPIGKKQFPTTVVRVVLIPACMFHSSGANFRPLRLYEQTHVQSISRSNDWSPLF